MNRIVSFSLAALMTFAHATFSEVSAAATTYYIDPDAGSDSNSGDSPRVPLKTIQAAIGRAEPGDTITLFPGDYYQNVLFDQRNGRPGEPITLRGPSSAIVRGTPSSSNGRVIQIKRDYITLTGFTIDGWRGPGDDRAGYNEQLIYLEGFGEGTATPQDVRGIRLIGLTLKNALQECIRLRARAKANEIAFATISNCGRCVTPLGCASGEQAEAISIGTVPQRLTPGVRRDGSDDNWVHDLTINGDTGGCIQINEGAEDSLVERVYCTGAPDPSVAGISVQGNRNTIRYSTVVGSAGPGISVGGYKGSKAHSNNIYRNTVTGNGSGIEFASTGQSTVCANTMSGNARGNVSGSRQSEYTPDASCGDVVLSIVIHHRERYRPLH